MAVISVLCEGRQWQDDFTPLVVRLYAYYGRCFRWNRDGEELKQVVVCYFMHRFRKYWKRGAPVRIATSFIAWHAFQGRCGIIPKPDRHHISVRAKRMTP